MARTQSKLCQKFGQAVRRRRIERGMTQEELAQASGLYRSYITDVERGARNVSLTNVARLVHALGMSIPAFFRKYEVDD